MQCVLRIAVLGIGLAFPISSFADSIFIEPPYGTSDTVFSIGFTQSVSIAPVAFVNSNGCPGGANCPPVSFWQFDLTLNFYDQSSSLLTTETGTFGQECGPSNCNHLPPNGLGFLVPFGATSFELVNDVTVGGSWVFEGAGEQINVPDSSLNLVSPLPAALPLFATGIGGLGMLSWRRKRKAQTLDLG